MSPEEDFVYEKLVAAMRAIVDRKSLHGDAVLDRGRRFEIIRVLEEARILDDDFAGDHVDLVKAAFATLEKPYPGDRIADCVAALLGGYPC